MGMTTTTLKTAKIIGFFSIPSAFLAEHNPTAYQAAMREIPAGAGVCSQCGTPLVHHVIIRDEAGQVRFIGTDCAEKVGCDREQLRLRLTDEQQQARKARWEARQAERIAREEEDAARRVARLEVIGDIVAILRRQDTSFHNSLADQLEVGPLTFRQATFVAKATSETGRRNKKNAAAWDALVDRCLE